MEGRSFFASAAPCSFWVWRKARCSAREHARKAERPGAGRRKEQPRCGTKGRGEVWEKWRVGRRVYSMVKARGSAEVQIEFTRDALTAQPRYAGVQAGCGRPKTAREAGGAVGRILLPVHFSPRSFGIKNPPPSRRKAEEKALRARRRYTMPCSPGRS